VRQTQLILMIGCLGVITLASGALRAQSISAGPRPGFRPMVQGGPPMFSFMGGRTVTGGPFSAQVTLEHTQTLPDGNLIDQKNLATVYRDGQGRTRLEETRPANSAKPRQVIRIMDPVATAASDPPVGAPLDAQNVHASTLGHRRPLRPGHARYDQTVVQRFQAEPEQITRGNYPGRVEKNRLIRPDRHAML
jgi:hypothetical protein